MSEESTQSPVKKEGEQCGNLLSSLGVGGEKGGKKWTGEVKGRRPSIER